MDDERFIALHNYLLSLDDPHEVTTSEIKKVMDINDIDYQLNESFINNIIELTILEKQ